MVEREHPNGTRCHSDRKQGRERENRHYFAGIFFFLVYDIISFIVLYLQGKPHWFLYYEIEDVQ